jgi:hypothetical protein
MVNQINVCIDSPISSFYSNSASTGPIYEESVNDEIGIARTISDLSSRTDQLYRNGIEYRALIPGHQNALVSRLVHSIKGKRLTKRLIPKPIRGAVRAVTNYIKSNPR